MSVLRRLANVAYGRYRVWQDGEDAPVDLDREFAVRPPLAPQARDFPRAADWGQQDAEGASEDRPPDPRPPRERRL